MPGAAPDWGALAGQLEQLLPHLAEARRAKAQLYQIGIVNSQLLQAGSSGSAPASEDERQRMLGVLERLWQQLLALFADLDNRVGCGSPARPQLQWWGVFEGACQLLQGGAQTAIACRMSAAAAAPLMAVSTSLQTVGMQLGVNKEAHSLPRPQRAAVIVCQLHAKAALLQLAEASGCLSQMASFHSMFKVHMLVLMPAAVALDNLGVPDAMRGQPTQALLRLLATVCTVCQRSQELTEAWREVQAWTGFRLLERPLEEESLARMAIVLALPAQRRPAGAPGWDAAADLAVVYASQLGVPDAAGQATSAQPCGEGSGSNKGGGGGGDVEASRDSSSGDAGRAADVAFSVSSGVSAARAAAQLVALMPLPGSAAAEAAGETAEPGSSTAPSEHSLSCTDAVWMVRQLGRTSSRLLACLQQQRQQAASGQQEEAAALQKLVHPLLQALPNLVATLQLAAGEAAVTAAGGNGAAAAGTGAEADAAAAEAAEREAAAGALQPNRQVTGQQWVAACEAAHHTLQLLLATLQPDSLQQQQHAAALGVTADGTASCPAVGSFADIAAWGNGLAAALRLLALTDAASQLEASHPEASGATDMLLHLMEELLQTCHALSLAVDAFSGVAAAAVRQAFGDSSAAPAVPTPAAPGGTPAQAVDGLWQLHSALCRAAQFAAARQGAGDAPTARALLGMVDARQLSSLAFALLSGATMLHAVNKGAHQARSPEGGTEAADAAQISRALHAMGCAHVELLRIAGVFCSDDESAEARRASLTLLPLLAAAAPALISAVAQLRQLCEQVLPSLSEEERQTFVVRILPHTSGSPQAAAALLLCCRAEDLAATPSRPGAQARWAADRASRAAATLLRGVAEEVGTVVEQGNGSEGSEAEEALQRLKAAMQSAAPFSTLTDGSRGMEATLAASRPLAQALLQWWQRPEGHAQQRLELARVAAARSCANLRCGNVGLEGGPAAGQGAGCKRCSACRAVWYCATACSHADWRGTNGHKHVCQALGEERRAEKERRRQAAGSSN